MDILICDDHKIMREGLRQLLGQLTDVKFIAESGNAAEALIELKNRPYHVLLLDISLPDKNGLEVLQSVKLKWPSTNVLILTMFEQEQYAIRAIKLGAMGYLSKNTASEELLQAVKKVARGERYISASLADSLASHVATDADFKKHNILSGREFGILIKLAHGKSLKEIGNEMCISNKTVSTYRSRVLEKMELKHNTELVRYCLENSLI